METVYILMPIAVAQKLEGGKQLEAADIPDPWEKEGMLPNQVPAGIISCYKDDGAAKSEQQLAQALLNLKLAIATVAVPSERLSNEWPKQSPDPSARLLSGGVNASEFKSVFYP